MNGDFPIIEDDLAGIAIPHAIAAQVLVSAGRNERRTDTRGYNVVPMLRFINALKKTRGEHLEIRRALEHAYSARITNEKSTALTLAHGTLDVTRDTGIERNARPSVARLQEAGDDPVLARLMEIHGVARIARVAGGVDGRWNMGHRSSQPYVAYAGLPAAMPRFVLRAHTQIRASFAEVHLGQGVVYTNQGGILSLSLAHPLPETVAVAMVGRAVTDVVSHPALDDLVFSHSQHGVDTATYAVEVKQ